MDGQRPPIPGSNEPLIVARRLVPLRERLADVRPDVTRWRSQRSSTKGPAQARAKLRARPVPMGHRAMRRAHV